jgi:hypothetical protein
MAKSKRPPTDIPPHSWTGTSHLRTVRSLNERCVGHLAHAASSMGTAGGSRAVDALQKFAGRLDHRACQRAGRCPVLLVDLKFQEGGWWDRVAQEVTAPTQLNAPPSLLAQEEAAPLLREILTEAWSISRTMPHAASLLFGMNAHVTQTISHLSMQDVERVVTHHARHLRPRWEHNYTFWPRLLQTVIGTDNEALMDIQLHCLSLLGN